jgi:site-specific DNA recombinase
MQLESDSRLLGNPEDSLRSENALTHTRRSGRLYRYHAAVGLQKGDVPPGVVRRVPAAEIEAAVVGQLRGLLRSPEIILATWRAARTEDAGIAEGEVREALLNLDPVWDELFPAEQTRILQLLVERVDVQPDGLDVKLRVDGISSLVDDLRESSAEQRAA